MLGRFARVFSFAQNILRVQQYAYKVKPAYVIAIYVLVPLLASLSYVGSYVMGQLVDELASPGRTVESVFILVILLFTVRSLNVLYEAESFFRQSVFMYLERYFSILILEKRAALDIAILENPKMNDLLFRFSSGGINRMQMFFDRIPTAMRNGVAVLIGFGVFVSSSWVLLLCAVLAALPALITETLYGKRVWTIYSGFSEQMRYYKLVSGAFFTSHSVSELKLFQNIEYFLKRAKQLFDDFHLTQMSSFTKYKAYNGSGRLFSEAMLGVAVVVLVSQVFRDEITIGHFTFIFASIAQFNMQLANLFSEFGKLSQDNHFVSDAFTILDTSNVVVQPTQGIQLPLKTPHIQFENVTFTYPGSDKKVFDSLNLTIPAGATMAIIGINGAGKTTLVKLLCRFYDPTEGRILIDGVDLRTIDIQSWYANLGVLFQDFERYLFTAEESIAIGRTNAPMDFESVTSAAEKSGAAEFIKNFNDGYKQQLGKNFTNGVELSKGQWQKMALARVFYRNPNVLILDEPTAAVDAEAEAQIFEKLESEHTGRTTILISHRFSTVRNADSIVILEGGKLIEQGTHTALMKKRGGTYARLFKLQAKGYE